jgi:hypothetical protein
VAQADDAGLENETAEEQGVVLAALMAGEHGAGPLERLAGEVGQRCRRAFGALRALDAAGRRRAVLQLSRRVFSPLPAGLEQVHPSWIQHVIERESPAVQAVLLSALPTAVLSRLGLEQGPAPRPDLPAWVRPVLCRRVLGVFGPMPPATPTDASPLERLEQLATWPVERLSATLTQLGLIVLASSATHTKDPSLAEAARAALPPALARRFDQAAKLELALPPQRQDHRGTSPDTKGRRQARPQRRPDAGPPEGRLLALGVELLAAGTPARAARQIAQRLPRQQGLPLWERRNTADALAKGQLLQLLQLADRWAREED